MSEKYYLFAGNNYYPKGGMLDYKGEFESIKDAVEYFRDHAEDISNDGNVDNWGHVVDDKLRIVKEVTAS